MNNIENRPSVAPTTATRKPVIAIMGEFSVGKSTLSNLLLGANPLPVKVTATQLPPVWISYGDRSPFREDLEGNVFPVDLTRLDEVPLEETSIIRIFLQSENLELCDFIDMPGISDPNMDSEVWERVIPNADAVIWCTHATQAWRQSEAAVWKTMRPELFENSFLLITRIDKLLSARDRKKVIKRVARETDGLFSDLFPISLTQAMEATEDRELWEKCGAEAFTQSLVDLMHKLSGENVAPDQPAPRTVRPQIVENTEPNIVRLDAPAGAPYVRPNRVVPSRVKDLTPTDRTFRRPDRPAATISTDAGREPRQIDRPQTGARDII